MRRDRCPDRLHMTRRQAIGLGLGLGTSFAMAVPGARSTGAQGTPEASPTGERDYARPEMLIDAQSLKELLGDPRLLVIGFMPVEEFDKRQIPGSVQLDWPALEVIDTSDESMRGWSDRVRQMLADLGVSPDRRIVTYDAGTLFAARLWWVLHYLGHEDQQVLNGGIAAWQAAGGQVEGGEAGPATSDRSGLAFEEAKLRPEVFAPREEVRARLEDSAVALVDARTAEEYVAGHIPGAVNVNFPSNAMPEAPKVWKSAEDLRAMYAAVGVTPDKRIIPYCATGVRSAVTAFTLRLIGYQDVGLYTGSWKEWSAYPELPIATGERP